METKDIGETKENLFTRMEAAAYNMQSATYASDKVIYERAHEEYTKHVKIANRLRVDPIAMDIAEARGRLRAAIEFEKEEDRIFFENQLSEKEVEK